MNTYQHFKLRLEPRKELALLCQIAAGLAASGHFTYAPETFPEEIPADVLDVLLTYAKVVYRSWRSEAASRQLNALERLIISTVPLVRSEVPLSGKEAVMLLGELAGATADIPQKLESQLPGLADLPEVFLPSQA